MSADATEISKLASILHQNGDKVLNALSKLSLNATLLQKINKEFQILVDNGNDEQTSTFQVLPNNSSNSQLIQDLQFLHDFIQKTVGLKLVNNINLSLLNNKIDLSKFKSIKYLEIKKIPIKELTGLKVIQSQLESIICIKCLSKLEELLAECGGDNSSGFVWSELKEAVLSYNNIKVVDTSVAFAPWLQVLDLSHNQITDIKAIECLPNLKYINLSYNCLDVIPTFNKSARKKMQVLVMKNNYVEDLAGLIGLDYLTELDLSCNWISSHEVLHPLLAMSALQWLLLEGNPISFQSNHRRKTVEYLHISASFGDFVLDKVKLSKVEKTVVGIKLCGTSRTSTRAPSLTRQQSSDKIKITPEEGSKTEEKSSAGRKSRKVRLAVIPNIDDGTYEEIPTDISNVNILGTSTEHLITKKRIETARAAFGSDNWLRCEAGSAVQDILGLTPDKLLSSTPFDDLCLAAAIDSMKKNVITTTAVIENQEEPIETAEKNIMDSFISCEDNGSNYFSIENSTDKLEIPKSTNYEGAASKETSPDIEPIQDSDEEPEDDNEKLYLVRREIKTANKEIQYEELFLSVTDVELKEKEMNHGKIITKWTLSSLASCIKLQGNVLQLVFDTIRRDKKERVYEFEPDEAQILYKHFSEILDNRSFSDMNQVVYKCINCTTEFSREKSSRNREMTSGCPFCNSKLVFEVDEITLPSSVNEKQTKNKINETKKTEIKSSHNRSSSAGIMQSFLTQNEEKMARGSSQSSIEDYQTSHSTEISKKSSATSLDELNELPAIQNTNVKRSDSDIEILSNPSQSSIEVIDGPTRMYGGNTPRRKRSSEERQPVPAQLVVPESHLQVNALTGLTESSSSGSITDSICTAYENNSMITSAVSRTEIVDVVVEESEDTCEKPAPKSFEGMIEEVIGNVSAKIQKLPSRTSSKPTDDVVYSYTDFRNVDHRIKLFLYAFILEENNEELEFLLRALVHYRNAESPYLACIVGSNRKLYILKITGPEEGNEASKFLQKSYSYPLNNVKCIYTLSWHQGLGVKIQDGSSKITELLILTKDFTRTRNFLQFLSSNNFKLLNDCKIIQECSDRSYLAMQQLLLSGASEDTNIQYFCLFSSCSVMDDPQTTDVPFGGILTTNTDLLLFPYSLNWFFEGSNNNPMPKYTQKLSNLMQVETDELKVILHFLNEVEGKEELWNLTMETSEAVDGLLNSMKTPWEEMFSVPLQISSL